jgi:hypothetical protein
MNFHLRFQPTRFRVFIVISPEVWFKRGKQKLNAASGCSPRLIGVTRHCTVGKFGIADVFPQASCKHGVEDACLAPAEEG